MWFTRWASVFLVAANPAMHAQSTLHIKTGDITPAAIGGSAGPQRMNANRWHGVVRTNAPPADVARALRARGVRVLGYLPGGFFVSIPEGVSMDDAGVEWSAPVEAAQKISPLLRSASEDIADFLVEFYADVPAGDARTIALRSGFLWVERPDLLPTHLLVRGSASSLRHLARWDEVAYIFPDMEGMARAASLYACGGALTTGGEISQSVAVFGNGWDGAGLGTASLYFSFLNVTAKLPAATVEAEVTHALDEWGKYVKVTFSPTTGARVRTIAVEFVTGSHGDGYPFTSGTQLAHAFYPVPVNPEPIAGDIHFNDVESWDAPGGIDLSSQSPCDSRDT